MKNIHILPTDKPSCLLLSHRNNLQFLKDNSSQNINNNFAGTYQNIYITSDVEIKDGWCINMSTNYIIKGLLLDENWKYILLTTDQDLINDGVQAISNEFLEWFVKNPGCDEVEVVNESYEAGNIHQNDRFDYYKIIIKPKEESYTDAQLKSLESNRKFLEEISVDDLNEMMSKFDELEIEYREDEVYNLLKFFVANTRGDKPWQDADDEWFDKYKKR